MSQSKSIVWSTWACCLMLALFINIDAFASPTGFAFYVSPDGDDQSIGRGPVGRSPERAFATIERARDAARLVLERYKGYALVKIHIGPGVYNLTEPLVLTPADSGYGGSWVQYVGHDNPLISGGRKLTGWKKHKGNIWKVDLPEVKAGKWKFRQLYVNGQLRRRARIPNQGFHRVAGFPDGGREMHYHTDCQRFEYAPGDIDPTWTNLTDVEVIVYHFWTDSHLPIKSLDTDKNIVTFKHKAGKVFTDDFTANGARYIVENVFEGLDAPGEWYLNRKTGVLYYIPMPDEDMTKAEVFAPVIPELIRLVGDPEKREFVEDVTFRGLSFMYTNWELPVGNSNDRQGSASVPAAITLTGARNCAFEDCAISRLGTFAFDIREGCSQNRFTGNGMRDIGAGGFRVNGGTHSDHPLTRTGDNLISDNTLDHFGQEYPSAVGVLLMNTSGNTVAHNEIGYGGYTGVSIGWSWGYQRSISRDNVVEFNHIHHIGQGLLSDMGAIYTLGTSPGTVIRNNLIHDVEANHYGGWGIYNDEGSSGILIEDNIVYRTKFAGYNIHFCKEVTVRNNIFALGRLQQLSRSRVEPHLSVFFENNIVYWTEGVLLDNNWRDKAHSFYFHPKDASGTREVTNTFDMDYNLYFNPNLKLEAVEFNKMNIDDWRKTGKDRHSIYADPKFTDPENDDFTLKPDSPAFALGFEPIDITTVGPRK